MLSATSQHALRALVHLSRLPPAVSILGRDLARQAAIPANYLAKILLTLRNAGIVETTRGQGGGYRLGKPASQIRLIDVVELFEGLAGRRGCLLGERHDCSDATPCAAHDSWKLVKQAYLDFLESKTVADISTPAAAVQPYSQAAAGLEHRGFR